MPKQTIVIDGDDRQHFFLSLVGQTLTVGDDPARGEGVLRNLHVTRIRCEVEIDDDVVAVTGLDGKPDGDPLELRPGVLVALGHAHLHLEAPPAAADATAPPAPTPLTGPAGPAMRLRVIDGADQGRSFPVPPAGKVTIGKNSKFADIVLHDLYVARVQCELLVEDGRVIVAHIEGSGGTRIDGGNVGEPAVLRPGSILRVGNSHLRLEVGSVADAPDADDESKSAILPKVATEPKSEILPKPGSSATHRPVAQATGPGSAMIHKADPMAQLTDQVFGHYRVGPILGRGFAGAVYQAQDTNTEQAVALKVLAAEFPATQAELDRFAKALTVAAHVPHANLVALNGGGRSGAHCWIAREYVDGESAAEAVRRVADGEKISWARACRVAAHLARALVAIHGHGRIHGNITPRNVLLRHDDHSAKLTDLMLAQALDGSQLGVMVADKKRATELPYHAPEQTEAGAFVDRLADLYAVGAVTYALLTGRPPHAGDTPKDVIASIRSGRVVKPTTHHKKVPATFEAVVLKLLARQQEDRYQTAAELLEDIGAIAGDHGLSV